MKKLNQLVIISVLLSILSPFGLAEVKIAIIDFDKAVFKTKFAQQQQKTLTENDEYGALMEKLQLLKADLQDLEKEANTKGMTWSNEQVAEHSNKVKYKSADYQLIAKKIESQRNNIINTIKEKFATTIKDAVNEIIKEEAIDLLLNAKAAYFARPDFDITKKVTAALDANS